MATVAPTLFYGGCTDVAVVDRGAANDRYSRRHECTTHSAYEGQGIFGMVTSPESIYDQNVTHCVTHRVAGTSSRYFVARIPCRAKYLSHSGVSIVIVEMRSSPASSMLSTSSRCVTP